MRQLVEADQLIAARLVPVLVLLVLAVAKPDRRPGRERPQMPTGMPPPPYRPGPVEQPLLRERDQRPLLLELVIGAPEQQRRIPGHIDVLQGGHQQSR